MRSKFVFRGCDVTAMPTADWDKQTFLRHTTAEALMEVSNNSTNFWNVTTGSLVIAALIVQNLMPIQGKGKSSLSTPERHTGWKQVLFHSFLTSELYGCVVNFTLQPLYLQERTPMPFE